METTRRAWRVSIPTQRKEWRAERLKHSDGMAAWGRREARDEERSDEWKGAREASAGKVIS